MLKRITLLLFSFVLFFVIGFGTVLMSPVVVQAGPGGCAGPACDGNGNPGCRLNLNCPGDNADAVLWYHAKADIDCTGAFVCWTLVDSCACLVL